MTFPTHRLRRLRRSDSIRRLVRETHLSADDLICPLFVTGEKNVSLPLASLPGVSLLSGHPLVEEARRIRDAGVPAVLLFPVPAESDKDETASMASSPEGPAQQAVRLIKSAVPDLAVITDLCLCEYTRSGHCGLLRGAEIDNDLTLDRLRHAAVSQAEAGADGIAPSAMMDGMVRTIRASLDEAGHQQVLTIPYSAKFASHLYGPFKEATRSNPAESRHATHQIDVANGRQALAEIGRDVEEGADIVIIKPALSSLDIVSGARRRFDVPIAAFSVSGEYRMVLAAETSDAGRQALMMELLTSIKRAGADMIITYFARAAAAVLRA
jgi:porphobilinogen synthase